MSAPSALEAARELLKAYPDGCYLQGSINAALVARAYIKEHEVLEMFMDLLTKARRTIELGERPYRDLSPAEHAEYEQHFLLGINDPFAKNLLLVAERMGISSAALSCSAPPEDK